MKDFNEKGIDTIIPKQSRTNFYLRRLLFPLVAVVLIVTIGTTTQKSRSDTIFSSLATTPSFFEPYLSPSAPSSSSLVTVENKQFPNVEFDGSSFSLLGQNIYIQSGEFHPWRLPVTDLWYDILQKAHAGGINTISIYTHWGLINPSPGIFDFEGFRSLSLFLDIAQQVGLWVIVRPGPYINAETTAGGIPGWVTTIKGALRTNATDYREAWEPYIRKICQITKKYQVSEGGPVILMQVENELEHSVGNVQHFAEIYQVMKSEGIVVPLTFNDWAPRGFFASGPVTADIYGFDDYPQHFDCANPTVWAAMPTNYAAFHSGANPNEPLYIPEYQAGAFDPWGGPGYDDCRQLTGPDFESVFYLNLWSSNVKLVSLYMLYGGTSWGLLAFPGVYTSYDYGAAISESRELGPKFDELKRQSLYLRSVRDFAKTDIVGNSSTIQGFEPQAFFTELGNPDTGAGFYVVRHANSSSTSTLSFDMTIKTKKGTVNLASKTGTAITLYGRQSKVVTTDLSYGASSRLAYTTGGILFAGKIGKKDVLYVHGDPLDKISMAFELTHRTRRSFKSAGPATIQSTPHYHSTSFIMSNPTAAVSAVSISPFQLVIYSDSNVAGTFWNPLISKDASNPRSNFYSFGTNETVLVGGPYLVRNASIVGSTLHIVGDLKATTTLTIFAPESVHSVTWNGVAVTLDMENELVAFGALVGTVTMKATDFVLPLLTNWKENDSLPEITTGFNDSDWTVAKSGALNNPFLPIYGDLWLYSCEYGFCEGATFWRGAFTGNNASSVRLFLSGGYSFAGSVWINNVFLGSTFGNLFLPSTDHTFDFPAGSLNAGENVLTVLVDNMGQNEGNEEPKSPRGIQGYRLIGGANFTSWKVQGRRGGNVNFPDKERGITNEGGFYGEREGWHLPTFDDSNWQKNLDLNLNLTSAGVKMFRTEFDLNIGQGVEIPLSFKFTGLDTSTNNGAFRSQLFVNGWSFGKMVSNLGPQTEFPVPPGILKVNGKNTVALIVWATSSSGASLRVSLKKGPAYSVGY